jgi:hypothetical protein
MPEGPPSHSKPDKSSPERPQTGEQSHLSSSSYDEVYNSRSPEQKEAIKLTDLEDKARSSDSASDRHAALLGIQQEARELNNEGLAYAKSVYAELAKNEGSVGLVPLIDLTDGGLKLQSGSKLADHLAKDQHNSSVELERSLNRSLRHSFGLPNSATDAQLNATAAADEHASMLKELNLGPNATDKEIQAAMDRQLQAVLREANLPAAPPNPASAAPPNPPSGNKP